MSFIGSWEEKKSEGEAQMGVQMLYEEDEEISAFILNFFDPFIR